jgi:hypothetical protein
VKITGLGVCHVEKRDRLNTDELLLPLDDLGIGPNTSRMLSGCDTPTQIALLRSSGMIRALDPRATQFDSGNSYFLCFSK